MRKLAVLVGILVVASNGLAQEPSPEQIWEDVLETYASAEDYSAQGKLRFEYAFFHTVVREETVYQRPNKLWLWEEYEGLGYRGVDETICDGKRLYNRRVPMHEYTEQRAPTTVAGIEQALSEKPVEAGRIVTIPMLLSGTDLSEAVEGVALERAGRYRGQAVHILEVTLSSGHSQVFWVGVDDHLIHKWTYRVDFEVMLEEMRDEMGEILKTLEEEEAEEEDAESGDETDDEGEDEEELDIDALLEGVREDMAGQFESLKEPITARFSKVRVNEGVPGPLFKFGLRYGDRRVSALSLAETGGGMAGRRSEDAGPAPEVDEPDLTGQEAPDFTLMGLDGNELTLSELRGKPVLLDFWASWCPPCCRELPHVQELHDEYGPKGLQIVAVSCDGAIEDAKTAAEEMGLTFTILWQDPDSEQSAAIDEAYEITGIPRLVLIDGEGTIVADVTGYHEKPDLVELLERVGL